jgi:predicted enzyme related to lactoylglutathione lyase
MEQVLGIGGIFFKAENPEVLAKWYADHLGVPVEAWGGAVFRVVEADLHRGAQTVWSPFKSDTDYFAPSTKACMVNFRVRDLDAMLAQLHAAGVEPVAKTEASEYGRFGWVMDPEGNKVELWEPPPT